MANTDTIENLGITPTDETPPKTMDLEAYEKGHNEVTIALESNYGRIIVVGGLQSLDMRKPKQPHLRNSLFQAMRGVLGASMAVKHSSGLYPILLLAKYHDQIVSYANEQLGDDYRNEDGYKDLWSYVMAAKADVERDFKARFDRGLVEYTDLTFLFKDGSSVVDASDEFLIGGIVDETEYVTSFFGSYFAIDLEIIHAFGKTLAKGEYRARIPLFNGLKKISDLNVKALTDDVKVQLERRGIRFRAITTGPSYLRYAGDISQAGWWGTRNSFAASGRVMVDAKAFSGIDANGYQKENVFAKRGEDGTAKDAFVLGDEDLWRTWPYVLGFSLRAKKWGRMDVEALSEIVYRDDAFDYLVLPEEDKVMVRALVEHSGTAFKDLVDEKGGGTIFCLHGEPGQGKTLLAETVAEITHKPLYAVSVGELGTEPSHLEDRLRAILDVATMWNAVLLVDEADIFMEARDTHDIVRNAMVGVFLRLLEYHQGVLFLTTNRVKTIDPAFFSRISVAIAFPPSDRDKRMRIWSNLVEAAGIADHISKDDITRLSNFDINGRQVKNAIRIGMTMAASQKRPITLADLTHPIERAHKFGEDLRAIQNADAREPTISDPPLGTRYR